MNAYFYHQQAFNAQRQGYPEDSEVPAAYEEYDPRGMYQQQAFTLDAMGMEDEAEGQRPSGDSEEDSESLDNSDSVLSSNSSDTGSESSDKKRRKKKKQKKKRRAKDKKKKKKDKDKKKQQKSINLSSKPSLPATSQPNSAAIVGSLAEASNLSLNYQSIIEQEQLYD